MSGAGSNFRAELFQVVKDRWHQDATQLNTALRAIGDGLTKVHGAYNATVYGFIYARVGNRADAEDLTQQVALKALPRLRDGEPAPAVRGYLYATARSVLATFWSGHLRLPESALPENVRLEGQGHELLPSPEIATCVARILDGLPPHHRQVLELRFLRGYSLQEVADEMGKTLGSVKVMQLRALRSAAVVGNALGFDF